MIKRKLKKSSREPLVWRSATKLTRLRARRSGKDPDWCAVSERGTELRISVSESETLFLGRIEFSWSAFFFLTNCVDQYCRSKPDDTMKSSAYQSTLV